MTLYYKETCPFCQNVLSVAEELNITLDLQDVTADQNIATKLVELGGKRQVPYLVDTDKDVAMYESEDIIHYLQEQYAGSAPTENKPKFKIHRSTEGNVCP